MEEDEEEDEVCKSAVSKNGLEEKALLLQDLTLSCLRPCLRSNANDAPDGNSPIVVELPLDRLEKDRSASDQWGDMGFVSNLLEEAGERSSGRDESCESDVGLGSGRD